MKIAYFSTGIPDPTQGGSGILNYYFCKYLLDSGHHVRTFFRVNKNFLEKHTNPQYLDELKSKGLVYELVIEDNKFWKKLTFGLSFVLQQHQYSLCKSAINAHRDEIMDYDRCFSLDLGWALALSSLPLPKICILGDTLEDRFKFGTHPSSLRGLFHEFRKISLKRAIPRIHELLKNFDRKYSVLGCFAPQTANDYQARGIQVRHFRWFSPAPTNFSLNDRVHHFQQKEKFVLLHFGSFYPTASVKMMEYCMEEIFPVLRHLPFRLEMRFIGKYDPKKIMRSSWKNIHFEYLGPISSLDKEFMNADAFFSPMKYPVGIRTRIITALSYAVPVIADFSSASALPELRNGFDILYTANPIDYFNIIGKLHDNTAFANEIGINGRKAWDKYFNPEKNIPELVNALQAI